MTSYTKKTMAFAVVVGLFASPLVMAGSVTTFHRSWTHGGGCVHSSGSPCYSVTVQSVPSDKAVSEPAKANAGANLAKSTEKAKSAAVEKTAKKPTTTRSFSYEPERSYSAPMARRSYSSTSRNDWNSGFSHDRAMAAKGYYSK